MSESKPYYGVVGKMGRDYANELPMELRKATPLESLNQRKADHERKLESINAAIKILEDNPGITEVLETLAKAGV